MAQACLGRYLQAILPPDLSWVSGGEEGAAVRAAIWPWAGELGGKVCIQCQCGSIRAVCEQMFCAVFAPARLRREDVSISGWRFKAADTDLEAAACQSVSLVAQNLCPTLPYFVIKKADEMEKLLVGHFDKSLTLIPQPAAPAKNFFLQSASRFL